MPSLRAISSSLLSHLTLLSCLGILCKPSFIFVRAISSLMPWAAILLCCIAFHYTTAHHSIHLTIGGHLEVVCLGANVLTLLWMLLRIFIECMLSLECLWYGEAMGHIYVHLVHTAEQVSQTIVQFILTMCFYSHFSPTTNSIYNCRISLSLSLVSIIPNHFFAGLIWWILVQTANKHVAPCFIF